MRILRAAEQRRMPWKNGGGTTTEIAVWPAEAGLDDFDWRVSMARVESDGPFSRFPGVDRSLSILDGAGLMLTVGEARPVALTGDSAALAFAADVPTSATLIAGPITDLNVMTRRGAFVCAVERIEVGEGRSLGDEVITTIVLVDSGEMIADIAAGGSTRLARRDAVILEPGETAWVRSDAACSAMVVAIRCVRSGDARS